TRVAFLLTLVTIGSVIANQLSDDPEHYVPLIEATIATALVLLAGHIRRKSEQAPRR
ncbi:MAG: hypothetical protein IH941_12245, partial [Acidobacteria bacterium]|nr:hypothetical protein [Acidobacteriota bacterium]